MTEARQAEYVSGKYGRWGLDRFTPLSLTQNSAGYYILIYTHSRDLTRSVVSNGS
jgi:hypothetical protein